MSDWMPYNDWFYKENVSIFRDIEIYNPQKAKQIGRIPAHFYLFDRIGFTIWYDSVEEAIADIDGAL